MTYSLRYRYSFPLVSLFWVLTLEAQPIQSLSGRVLGYLNNRIGDYDGVRLQTPTGEVRLRMPPHTAALVLKGATVGQLIRVTVTDHPSPRGPASPNRHAAQLSPTYRLVSLQNPQTKMDIRLADYPPPPPTQGKLVEQEDTLTGELHDEAGRLSALLTTQYVIELKPHQGESIRTLLGGIRRVSVVGYERITPGFVNKTGRKLIHPTTLTINGQTFAL